MRPLSRIVQIGILIFAQILAAPAFSQKPELVIPEGAVPEFQAAVLFDNGKMIAVGGDDILQIIETRSGLLVKRIPMPGKKIRQILVSPNQDMIAVMGLRSVSLLDPATLTIKAELPGASAAFSHGHEEIITFHNGSLKVYNYRQQDYRATILSPGAPVYYLKTGAPNYLLAFCLDSTLRIWDLVKKEITWEISQKDATILNAGISPAGDKLFLLSSDDKAFLYSLDNRSLLFRVDSGVIEKEKYETTMGGTTYATVPDHSKLVKNEVFSKDGRFFMIWGGEQVQVFRAEDLSLVKENFSTSNPVFSPNGQYVACRYIEHGISRSSMMNIADPKQEKGFPLPKEDLGWYRDIQNPASFSADSRYFVNDNLEIIDMQQRSVEYMIGKSSGKYDRRVHHFQDQLWIIETGGEAHVWDLQEGQIAHFIPGSLQYNQGGTAIFSNEKDSTWLITRSGGRNTNLLVRGKFKSYHKNTGLLICLQKDSIALHYSATSKTFRVKGLLHAALHKGPQSQVLLGRNDSIILLNTSKVPFKTEMAIRGNLKDISPDSTRILVARTGAFAVECWSLVLKRKIYDSEMPVEKADMVFFSPNGKLFTSSRLDFSSSSYQLVIYLAETGKALPHSYDLSVDESRPFFQWGGGGAITGISRSQPIYVDNKGRPIYELLWTDMTGLSRDDKLIQFVKDDTLSVWDNVTAKKQITVPSALPYKSIFSPDNKYIVSFTRSKDSVVFWKIQDGRAAFSLPVKPGTLSNLSFNKTGSLFLISSYQPETKVKELLVYPYPNVGARPLSTIRGNALVFEDSLYNIVESFDSSVLVVYDKNWNKLRQIGTESLLFDYKHQFAINSKQSVIAAYENRLLKFTHLEKGRLYNLHFMGGYDYLVTNEKDHFDGTDRARKRLYYTCGKEIIELNQVKEELWVPGLVKLIMKGEEVGSKTLKDLEICGVTPLVEEKEVTNDHYRFDIQPRSGGLGKVSVLVNGIEIMNLGPEHLKRNAGKYELAVPRSQINDFLIPGHVNPVKVIAYVADNSLHSRGFVLNEKRKTDSLSIPNLFAVMIGVSDYKGEELDLKYAAKDALDISNAVDLLAGKLLNTDGQQHVFTYRITTDSTHVNWPSKSKIQRTFQEIGQKAKANDILLLFFAGHGVIRGDSSGGQFYFLSSDAAFTSQSYSDVAISMDELSEWLRPSEVKAQKRILIFDACASGGSIRNLVKIGRPEDGHLASRNDEKARQAKVIDNLNARSGFSILAASASNQSAYEFGRYSQGLLTYSLLKTLKQEADILEEGKFLSVSRWFNAAEKTVRELSILNGTQQDPQLFTGVDFNLGIVDEDVLGRIMIGREKMLFTHSNMQNQDNSIAFDNLEIGKLIDLELRRVASSVNTGRISFITPTQDPDACFISGRYQVSDNKVKCVVQIIQNKLVKTRFEITGESSDLKKLAQEIVQKIDAWTETVSLVKGNSLMSTPRPREAPEYSASSAVN